MFVRSPVPPRVTAEATVPEVRDVEWFKVELLKMRFCSVHVAWYYKEMFPAVPGYLMDGYIHYLPELSPHGLCDAHTQALVLAQCDYEARLLHPWNFLD